MLTDMFAYEVPEDYDLLEKLKANYQNATGVNKDLVNKIVKEIKITLVEATRAGEKNCRIGYTNFDINEATLKEIIKYFEERKLKVKYSAERGPVQLNIHRVQSLLSGWV